MAHPAEPLKLKTFFNNRHEKEKELHGDLSQTKNNGSNDGKVRLQCQVFIHITLH